MILGPGLFTIGTTEQFKMNRSNRFLASLKPVIGKVFKKWVANCTDCSSEMQ